MRKIVWVIVLCLVAACAWYYFHTSHDSAGSGDGQVKGADTGEGAGKHGGPGGGKNAVVPVSIATAAAHDISVYLDGLGNITPRSTVTVHTLVNGQLMTVLFNEGQMVKKDDVLARIDDRPYTAILEQAQGFRKRDEALLAEAKTDLARYQELWKQDSIARQQLDLQTSLVKQYEGAVENDQGQIDAARTNLAYTRITAPVTGRVGLRQVDAGNIVHTTDTNGIVVVTELQPITAIFTVPEDSLPGVFKHVDSGEKLVAEAWDRGNKNKLATGTLTAIDNQVDSSTGTVKFRAEFANEDNALFPSQFVNIRLKLATLTNAVTIPSAGIQRGTHGTFVYLLAIDKGDKNAPDKETSEVKTPVKSPKSRTVTVQDVTVGPAEGDMTSITKGIAIGDQVVIDGTDSLKDGAKINVADTDGKPAPASGADTEAGGKPHKHKKHTGDGNP